MWKKNNLPTLRACSISVGDVHCMMTALAPKVLSCWPITFVEHMASIFSSVAKAAHPTNGNISDLLL
jgi:hypothetical protein